MHLKKQNLSKTLSHFSNTVMPTLLFDILYIAACTVYFIPFHFSLFTDINSLQLHKNPHSTNYNLSFECHLILNGFKSNRQYLLRDCSLLQLAKSQDNAKCKHYLLPIVES